jgi:cleavage and polyadenylation specificity factor subunit 1
MCIVHVCSPQDPDGTERQTIKDIDGNMPRPKIRVCSICDPFVLILREDDTIGLFIGETERGKIRRKDMSPMGDKVGLQVSNDAAQ